MREKKAWDFLLEFIFVYECLCATSHKIVFIFFKSICGAHENSPRKNSVYLSEQLNVLSLSLYNDYKTHTALLYIVYKTESNSANDQCQRRKSYYIFARAKHSPWVINTELAHWRARARGWRALFDFWPHSSKLFIPRLYIYVHTSQTTWWIYLSLFHDTDVTPRRFLILSMRHSDCFATEKTAGDFEREQWLYVYYTCFGEKGGAKTKKKKIPRKSSALPITQIIMPTTVTSFFFSSFLSVRSGVVVPFKRGRKKRDWYTRREFWHGRFSENRLYLYCRADVAMRARVPMSNYRRLCFFFCRWLEYTIIRW